MLVNCNTCKKKFSVPDSAITEAGRLLQCGTCGNKWTQYPVEEKLLKEAGKTKSTKIKVSTKVNKIKTKAKKKKREIGLYTDEYLKKKHGLVIGESADNNKVRATKISFNFYSYFLTIIIFIITLFGVLNLSKDIIIMKFPFTESYINYIYGVFDIIKISIFSLIN
jgi:predicted Zn finger-like uncharacterized protein